MSATRGRCLAGGEGACRAVSQALLKPFAELTRTAVGGGVMTGVYGLFLVAAAVGARRGERLAPTRAEWPWVLAMGTGSAARSLYYFAAYLLGAPGVIPFLAMSAATTAWLVVLERALLGTRATGPQLVGTGLSVAAAWFLLHCPDPSAPRLWANPDWAWWCLAVSPLSGLSVVAARRLAVGRPDSVAAPTFWNGVTLLLVGAAAAGAGHLRGEALALPPAAWALLLACNLISVVYVPLGLAALRLLTAVEKTFWVLAALGAATVLLRAAEVLSARAGPVPRADLAAEAVGLALYLVSALLFVARPAAEAAAEPTEPGAKSGPT